MQMTAPTGSERESGRVGGAGTDRMRLRERLSPSPESLAQ